MEEILTPSNVAELLRIHVQTVYRLAAEGKIPGNRIGRSWRFRRADILGLISDQRTKPSKRGKFADGRAPKREAASGESEQ